MAKQPWQILKNNSMKIKEEHHISENPYLGRETSSILLGTKRGVNVIDPTTTHQQFEKYLPKIAHPLKAKDSKHYFFQDGEVSGRIELKPLVYCHKTDDPKTFKYWDKVVLRWQPANKEPSELLRILDEFGFKKE